MTYINEGELTGVNLSGSDGYSNRTFTLTNSNVLENSINIIIDGTAAMKGSDRDYTYSGGIITFVRVIYDDSVLQITYYVTTTSSTGSTTNATYATTQELAEFMHIESKLPDITAVGTDRLKEEVGTGDGSETIFFLDHGFVIADTYTLYYGATSSAITTLTEDTHYILDKDNGQITLTSAGVTLLSTNKIWAKYSYCKINLTNDQLQVSLNYAQTLIDNETNNHFATGTDATPDYNKVTNEKHDGKGAYDNDYYLKNYSLPDISTTVNGAITAGDTTITVDSTNGFPSTGIICIGNDKILYTDKTTTTFTGCTSVSAHDDDTTVLPYCVEISGTGSGTEPTWTVLTNDTDYDINLKTGRIKLASNDLILNSISTGYPPKLVANRLRVSYLWGENTIPNDIKLACLMLGSKNILHTAVRKAHGDGMNDFNPSMINIDDDWLKSILGEYTNYKMSNV